MISISTLSLTLKYLMNNEVTVKVYNMLSFFLYYSFQIKFLKQNKGRTARLSPPPIGSMSPGLEILTRRATLDVVQKSQTGCANQSGFG